MHSAPVFYPQKNEFKSFVDYFKKIERNINDHGVVNIKPPLNWNPTFVVDLEDKLFEKDGKMVSIMEYGREADDFKRDLFNKPVDSVQAEEVEELFWKDPERYMQRTRSVETSKSGFACHDTPHLIREDEDYIDHHWNLNNTHKQALLQFVSPACLAENEGSTLQSCMSSTGCWQANYLGYMVDYLHWGDSKTWYVMSLKKHGVELMNHMLSHDSVLDVTSLSQIFEVVRVVQNAGDFIIISPSTLIFTLSHGFNFSQHSIFLPYDWLYKEGLALWKMGNSNNLQQNKEQNNVIENEVNDTNKNTTNDFDTLLLKIVEKFPKKSLKNGSNYRSHPPSPFLPFSFEELVIKYTIFFLDHMTSTETCMMGEVLRLVLNQEKIFRTSCIRSTKEAGRAILELQTHRSCVVCGRVLFLSSLQCASCSALTCLKHQCTCGKDGGVNESGSLEAGEVRKADENTKDLFHFRYTIDEMEKVCGRLEERMRKQQSLMKDVEGVLMGGVEKKASSEVSGWVDSLDELKVDNTKLKQDFLNFISHMKSCISRSQNFLSDDGSDHSYEDMRKCYHDVISLPCVIPTCDPFKEKMCRIERFIESVSKLFESSISNDEEATFDQPIKQLPPLNEVDHLVEISESLNVDLDQKEDLHSYQTQRSWMEKVLKTLTSPPSNNGLDAIKKLLKQGKKKVVYLSGVDPLMGVVERCVKKLEEVLKEGVEFEDEVSSVLKEKDHKSVSELESLLERSKKMFTSSNHHTNLLHSTITSARNWTHHTKSILTSDPPMMLHRVHPHLNEGTAMPVKLDGYEELKAGVERVEEAIEQITLLFMADISHKNEVLEVLAPKINIIERNLKAIKGKKRKKKIKTFPYDLYDKKDVDAMNSSLKVAEEKEMEEMNKLKKLNNAKCNYKESLYCVCRKHKDPSMIICVLCHDYYHLECVEEVNKDGAYQHDKDAAFLCMFCKRSRRPELHRVQMLGGESGSITSLHHHLLTHLVNRCLRWQQTAKSLMTSQSYMDVLRTLPTTINSIQQAIIINTTPKEASLDQSANNQIRDVRLLLNANNAARSLLSSNNNLLVQLERCEQEGHMLEVEVEEEQEIARVVQLFSSLRTLLQKSEEILDEWRQVDAWVEKKSKRKQKTLQVLDDSYEDDFQLKRNKMNKKSKLDSGKGGRVKRVEDVATINNLEKKAPKSHSLQTSTQLFENIISQNLNFNNLNNAPLQHTSLHQTSLHLTPLHQTSLHTPQHNPPFLNLSVSNSFIDNRHINLGDHYFHNNNKEFLARGKEEEMKNTKTNIRKKIIILSRKSTATTETKNTSDSNNNATIIEDNNLIHHSTTYNYPTTSNYNQPTIANYNQPTSTNYNQSSNTHYNYLPTTNFNHSFTHQSQYSTHRPQNTTHHPQNTTHHSQNTTHHPQNTTKKFTIIAKSSRHTSTEHNTMGGVNDEAKVQTSKNSFINKVLRIANANKDNNISVARLAANNNPQYVTFVKKNQPNNQVSTSSVGGVEMQNPAHNKMDNEDEDVCSLRDCKRPTGNVSWVLCDSCQKWYHVVCLSVSLQHLKKLSQFICPVCL